MGRLSELGVRIPYPDGHIELPIRSAIAAKRSEAELKARQVVLLIRLAKGMAQGWPMSGIDFLEKGLFGCDVIMDGIDKIPQKGPLLVVSDHLHTPWQSMDLIASVSKAVQLARNRKYVPNGHVVDSNIVHWIQAATPKHPALQHKAFHAQDVYQRFAQSFDSILVYRDNPLNNLSAIRRIRRIWQEGGIVGLHPEADAYPVLGNIHPAAENLLLVSQNLKSPPKILPIAAWRDKNTIHVNTKGPIDPHDPDMALGGLVMKSLASLLPPHFRNNYQENTNNC